MGLNGRLGKWRGKVEKWRGGRFGKFPILAVLLYGISCFIFFSFGFGLYDTRLLYWNPFMVEVKFSLTLFFVEIYHSLRRNSL